MRSLPYCRRRGPRTGAAVVEFAIVAPLLFLLVLGIIEFGRMVMVQQVLTNASREGARRAILEQSTNAEVRTIVSDYLTNASVPGATIDVTPADFSTLNFGDAVTVSVEVSYDQVSWLPGSWFLGGTIMSAQSTMQAERPQ